MKRTAIRAALLVAVALMTAPAAAQSAMTDGQVLQYVKDGLAQGKDKRAMAAELARKGVTEEQARRVKELYERQEGTASPAVEGTAKAEAVLRTQQQEDPSAMLTEKPEAAEVAEGMQVYGRDIFNTRNLTFEPNANLATPPSYRLGPGDEVVVDIWGASRNTLRLTISPEGTADGGELGPVYLSGMTIREAQAYLEAELRRLYADSSNQIRVTLGNTRTIQINVMGEVRQPGTYALSAFSTLFHALYRAGGVSPIGSLRSVKLVRQGQTVADVDVYRFIMQGKAQDDIRLEEGDVVIVPPYQSLVQITGRVKRPMRYEMKQGETLATLIGYAGGFTADAYTRNLRAVRQDGREYRVQTVPEDGYASFALKDGDVVTVEAVLDRFANRVEVRGAVYRPGIYELGGEGATTVRGLLAKADGLMPEAFTARAVLYRERENRTREVLQVDMAEVQAGRTPDIALRPNDVLYVPSLLDLQDLGNVQVYGEVARPGEYPYADNMTLEDLVIGAGGLKESASTVRVDVARRIKDPKGTEAARQTAETFSFALRDGFVVEGQPGFTLRPYDQVYVRRSPAYQPQRNVSVGGEVLYGGTYALTAKNERLSDLVAKAGGATPYAYVRGAKLTRRANAEELRRMRDVVEVMRKELGQGMADSLGIRVQETFTVGIDLEEALRHPGGEADIVLREGDALDVPEYVSTVRVSGAVMMDNTVAYTPGASVKHYIGQAGGYSQNAKKKKKFIVYMNGQIAQVKGKGKRQVEPGCEIIVPGKRPRRTNLGDILGYATSFSSLGTMAASIANLLK